LIALYRCFEDEASFKALKAKLDEHRLKHSETYFHIIRAMDRDKGYPSLPDDERAARLIYLNKTCFNGLYRVNKDGFFNVPFAHPKRINLYDEANFQAIFKYFSQSDHRVSNVDFEEAVKDAGPGDFVYFDPPYDVWEGNGGFTSYSKNPFGKDEQRRLANLFHVLSERGVYLMLSNHNTDFIRDLYSDFRIAVVPARRMINSDAAGRGCVEEVIVTNYETR